MNKILFVDDRNSFVVKGISEKFREENEDCLIFPLDREKIGSLGNELPKYLFLCVYEDGDDKNVQDYAFLKDICSKGDRKVFLMGFKEDVDKVQGLFEDQMIADIFYRPANAGKVTESIRKVIQGGEEEAKGSKKNILLVDDSGTLLKALKEWLSDEYRVTMASSAMNALFYIANNIPDLILLDYSMPVCSGPQLFSMLRSDARTNRIPVIFLTGVEDSVSTEEILALSPDGYMLKSTSREGILSQIDAFFENA